MILRRLIELEVRANIETVMTRLLQILLKHDNQSGDLMSPVQQATFIIPVYRIARHIDKLLVPTLRIVPPVVIHTTP